MVPRKHIPPGVKVFDTMNARVEGISSKRSFRSAWTKLQLALIPCEHFYEPDYETGKAVRWRIGLASGEPLAIAGLWRSWKEPEGGDALSFTMLTVNADAHPLMSRFHRPASEKRSVVIVPAAEHAAWLASRSTDEAYSFLRLFPADELHAEPYPLPLRAPRAGGKSASVRAESDPSRPFGLPRPICPLRKYNGRSRD
jgi:putative SOS response-associated peptidase YedK